MGIESGSGSKIHLDSETIPASFTAEIRDWKNTSCLFYADTSKANGQLITYPMSEDINLEDEEQKIDNFLLLHSFPSKISRKRLCTTIDPKLKQEYKIVEFPIEINGELVLSIKQAVRQNGRLIALSYRLAELSNS